VRIGDVPVLLVRVDGDVYAVRNQCGESPLPLEFSTLDGAELRCSWHGCRYDVRSGHRTDGQAGRLQVFPVSVEGGRIRVALDVAAAGSAEP
jgi:nitrite reductase/ring-hydroxylating ferredoxin subunit